MKKTNNKGFSLVELIIVIAIMAILIGVLAPQYIKYVERSRVSADKDMIDSLTKAAQTAITDDDYYDDIDSSNSIVINGTNVTVSGTGLTNAVTEFYGSVSNSHFKSKAFKNATITIGIDDSGTTLKVTVSDGSGTYDPSNYS